MPSSYNTPNLSPASTPEGQSGHAGRKIVAAVAVFASLGALAAPKGYEIYEKYSAVHHALPPGDELPPLLPPVTETLICAADSTRSCDDTALDIQATGRLPYNVSLSDIPLFTQRAFIDEEDKRFYSTDGIDDKALAHVLTQDGIKATIIAIKKHTIKLSTDDLRGGSGLENQYVGKAYPNPFQGDRVATQLYDMALSLRLDKHYTKPQILEKFLNTEPLGRGAVGVGAASMALYGVSITSFDTSTDTSQSSSSKGDDERVKDEEKQVAIVAMSDIPTRYDFRVTHYHDPANYPLIYQNSVALRNKEYVVINAMEKVHDKALPPADAVAMKHLIDSRYKFDSHDNVIGVNINKIPFVPYSDPTSRDIHNAAAICGEQFVDFVTKEMKVDLGLSPSDPLPPGKIYTTLDLQDQAAACAAMHDRDNPTVRTILDSPTLNDTMESLRPNGSIAAMVGSDNYDKYPGNLAIDSRRSVGSILKTLVVAEAIKQGMHLTDNLHIPRKITYHGWTIDSGQGCEYQPPPHNVAPCDLTLEEALAGSSDAMTVLVAERIGLTPILQDMEAVGLPVNQQTTPQVLLGNIALSPDQVASAYASFLNGGRKVTSYAIAKFVSPTGKTIWQQPNAINMTAIFSPSVVTDTIQALKDTAKEGTLQGIFSLPNGPRSVGGKTGTTGTPGSAKAPSDLDTAILACDTKRGNRIVVNWAGDPRGNYPIYNIGRSGLLATIDNEYLAKSLNTGVACDVAAANAN